MSTIYGALPTIAARGSPAAAGVRIMHTLLRDYPGGVGFRLWDGVDHRIGGGIPAFTIVIKDPAVLRQLVLRRSPLLLADCYFRDRIDFEGDLYAALGLKQHFKALAVNLRESFGLLYDALALPGRFAAAPDVAARTHGQSFRQEHSRHTDRAAIAFHYDASNAFYRLWLDEQMVYSCAVFERPTDSLEQAQRNKLDLICRKLRLQGGERFLDIGCGWGALVCWAARHFGVRAHGVTLSQQQLEVARERIAREGLRDRVTVELRDYRDLQGEAVFDKVASVGMFEHVGLANLPTYNSTVHRLLRPGGLFLNHGITRDEEAWKKSEETEFINRYVFPDAAIDYVSNIGRGMERAGFEIHDMEGLRPHYARTLRHWVSRLEAAHEPAVQLVGEARYRVWRLYMTACALQFEDGATGVHQILASRRGPRAYPVPETRRDLYA
jgi:cyclopropane-fatty-acyl-phospholipid synthase